MNLTPEQTKVLDNCALALKIAFGGLKRIVFDLASENEPDKVRWEIHGKTVTTKTLKVK